MSVGALTIGVIAAVAGGARRGRPRVPRISSGVSQILRGVGWEASANGAFSLRGAAV